MMAMPKWLIQLQLLQRLPYDPGGQNAHSVTALK